jgi:hypothetical protein
MKIVNKDKKQMIKCLYWIVQVCALPRIVIQPPSKISQKIEWKNVNIDNNMYQGALALHIQYIELEKKTTINVTISDFFAEVEHSIYSILFISNNPSFKNSILIFI